MLGPKDPLAIAPGRELFEALARVCNGRAAEEVVCAAANLIINGVRQAQPTRDGAERAFDEAFGRMKGVLMGHYSGNGRKKGIFPYDQVVVMECFRGDDQWPRQ